MSLNYLFLFLLFNCIFINKYHASSFSPRQKQQIEQEILELLDMPKKPNVRPREKHELSTKFLLNAYEFLENSQVRTKRQTNNFFLTTDEQQKIANSDVIISFENINKNQTDLKLVFDTSDIPKVERIIAAELRFLHWNPFKVKDKRLILTAYKPVATANGFRNVKIASKTVRFSYYGSITLNVTPFVRHWLESNETTHTLILSFRSQESQEILKPSDLDLEPDLHRAYIVGYFEADNTVKVRKSRQVFTNFTSKPDIDSGRCLIHRFEVKFKDLEWDDWVIAPQNFSSSYCKGSCQFPKKFGEKATNHALIQTLVHIKQPHRVPLPRCAPNELSQLTVLYQQHQNVVLKKFKDMLVQSCGCH